MCRWLVGTVKILIDIIVYGMFRPEGRPLSDNTETLSAFSCKENNRKKEHRRRKLTEHERKKEVESKEEA
jgi:hypothetical protein